MIQENDVDTRLKRGQQGTPRAVLAAIEERMRDPVSGLDTVFFCGATDYFQNPFRQPARRDDPGG